MVKILQSVLDKVYCMANIRKAGAKVCADKKVAGVDKVTVETWRTKEEAHLRQLYGELYADIYRSRLCRMYIPKPGTSKQKAACNIKPADIFLSAGFILRF